MKPLAALGQIALSVTDADRAQAFYRDMLGLPFLFRFGPLVFCDCAGVRLMLDGGDEGVKGAGTGCLYFRTDDIADAHATLKARGVGFDDEPHLIAEDARPRALDGVLQGPGRQPARADGGTALVSRVRNSLASSRRNRSPGFVGRPHRITGYAVGRPPRLTADFIRSFCFGTPDSGH